MTEYHFELLFWTLASTDRQSPTVKSYCKYFLKTLSLFLELHVMFATKFFAAVCACSAVFTVSRSWLWQRLFASRMWTHSVKTLFPHRQSEETFQLRFTKRKNPQYPPFTRRKHFCELSALGGRARKVCCETFPLLPNCPHNRVLLARWLASLGKELTNHKLEGKLSPV